MKPEQRKFKGFANVIKDAKKAIADVRATCPHDDKEKGLWMWAEGYTIPAIVCTYCGAFIEADNSISCNAQINIKNDKF